MTSRTEWKEQRAKTVRAKAGLDDASVLCTGTFARVTPKTVTSWRAKRTGPCRARLVCGG